MIFIIIHFNTNAIEGKLFKHIFSNIYLLHFVECKPYIDIPEWLIKSIQKNLGGKYNIITV